MGNDTKILDSIMGCSICGYYTCNIRNFARHQTSKKHLLKIDEELNADAEPDTFSVPVPDAVTEFTSEPEPEPEPEPDAVVVVEKNPTPRRRTKTRTKSCAITNETSNNITSCLRDDEDDVEDTEFGYYPNQSGIIHELSHIFMLLITFLYHVYKYSTDCLFESEPYMNVA